VDGKKEKQWFNFKIQKLGLPGLQKSPKFLEQDQITKITLQQQELKKLL
jgi:hypothetical protein